MFVKAKRSKRRDLSGVCEPGKSQSLHSTGVVKATERAVSKAAFREGRQEGRICDVDRRSTESIVSAQYG